MTEDYYFEPPYCDYCGGAHDSSVCRDADEDYEDEEEEDDPLDVLIGYSALLPGEEKED